MNADESLIAPLNPAFKNEQGSIKCMTKCTFNSVIITSTYRDKIYLRGYKFDHPGEGGGE